jgi:hypothetical protein
MTDLPIGAERQRASYIWERHSRDWYVEPPWCSERLFAVEPFIGTVWDPCAGGGNIVRAAKAAGLDAHGTDITPRDPSVHYIDFLSNCCGPNHDKNIVTNPPFGIARRVVELALVRVRRKVAVIFPVARLNAARWLADLPLARIWLLTPRPSMPPGETILRGEKPGGGKMDYCWLVFERGHQGAPAVQWLHRDGFCDSNSAR